MSHTCESLGRGVGAGSLSPGGCNESLLCGSRWHKDPAHFYSEKQFVLMEGLALLSLWTRAVSALVVVCLVRGRRGTKSGEEENHECK